MLEKKIPQGLMLVGPEGVGLLTIARALAKSSGAVAQIVGDEAGNITIQTVRELYVRTRSKTSQKEIFILDNAEGMGRDAQNAFLKLLEEPNKTTYFILTAHDKSALLPTILSRVQVVEVKRMTRPASAALLRAHGVTEADKLAQLLFIASGLPAELLRLTADEAYQRGRIAAASQAKQFLTGTMYQRIAMISSISSRDEATEMLALSLQMLRVQLGQHRTTDVLHKINMIVAAKERIEANGHIRTQLLRIALL